MNLLLVGVGGIGCEFSEVFTAYLQCNTCCYPPSTSSFSLTLVDPDTIEASNLPRQRLFTSADISLPKAQVAASRLPSSVYSSIHPFIERIQSLSADFFAGFTHVVMAVDDVDTRRWCNGAVMQYSPRLEMILDLGSKGFQGSCRLFRSSGKGKGGCLECTAWLLEEAEAKAAMKPVCQVHGRPGDVDDCIIWAAERNGVSLEEIIVQAKERAREFGIPTGELTEELVKLKLKLVVPAVASVNALIAVKAVQLLMSKELDDSIEAIDSIEENFFYFNFEDGVYEHSALLERDPLCPFCM